MAENGDSSLALLDTLTSKEKRLCIETLIKIFRNVVENSDPKYRKLRVTNGRFKDEVWRHEGAQVIMVEGGWTLDGDFVSLPPDVDVTPTLALLLDNRDVKPNEDEWVEETKHVIKNPEKELEDKLRKKALEEKKKEMARLKKDMEERKAIANRILAEHRNDREKKILKPSIARQLGGGESAKMSDFVDEGG